MRGQRVGIIGGGQLGAMLCQAARPLGVHTTVLAPDPDCPAARFADDLVLGRYDDLAAAETLAARTDVITFEIESVSTAVLRRLAELSRLRLVKVAPDPAVMLCLQNKLTQKQWLLRNGLPTNRFLAWDGNDPDPEHLSRCFGLPLVQKALTGGYDGRGVQILRRRSALANLWRQPSLIEAYLADVRELSVLVAGNGNGDLSVYDPVELEFLDEANILDRVIAPARVSRALKRRAMGIAKAAISRLATPGLFAVELFALPDDSMLINEISPRVHNSGHHTIEACQTSQFEQQLRAVLGAPLGFPGLLSPAVTQNILHDPRRSIPFAADHSDTDADTIVHWYGKRPDRPWRKLGHVTCLTDDPALARQRTSIALSGSGADSHRICA